MKNRHEYPAEWFDTIRPAVLARDQYKCQVCGAPHRSTGYYNNNQVFVVCDEFMLNWCKRTGQKTFKMHLNVAHKDQNKSNCELSNLQALCPLHHLQYDKQFNAIKRRMRGRQQGTGGGRRTI